MKGKERERLVLRVCGIAIWAVLPVLPRRVGLAMLHRYFHAAYAWRAKHIPSRQKLVATWRQK